MAFRDLREYLSALEEKGKLHHVKAEVDKDWEIAAVGRRVFQNIPPEKRPVVMFDHVKGFDIPVLIGSLGASPEVYGLALQCSAQEIHQRWEHAQLHPIKHTNKYSKHILQRRTYLHSNNIIRHIYFQRIRM